jgi:hypothetical protein
MATRSVYNAEHNLPLNAQLAPHRTMTRRKFA